MSSYRARFVVASVCAVGMVVIGCAAGGKSKESSSTAPCPYAKNASRPVSEAVARGGQLYDKFWVVLKTDGPKGDHPLWATRPDKESNKRGGSTTWRCKECHGWDYLGVYGAYKKGSHRTGFPGIAGSKKSTDEIVALLAADPAAVPGGHGYGVATGLSDDDLRALAEFAKEGVMNTTYLIDQAGRFTGEAERGTAIYQDGFRAAKSCKECHGADGLKPPKEDNPTFDEYVGKVANENAYEFLHKIRFGHPGTEMPALATQGLGAQEMADLGAYAQTLPKGP